MCVIPILIAATIVAIYLFTRTTKGLPKEGRSLYLATLVVEQACVITRGMIGGLLIPIILMPVWLVMLVVFGIAYLVTKQWAIMATGLTVGLVIDGIAVLIFAIGPVVWSGLHVMGLIGSSRFDRWVMKARKSLSDREKHTLVQALGQIPNVGALKMFSGVFVMASWHTERFEVIGTDLFLAKCLLHDSRKYLPAVLAHALGWVNTADGRLVMALRRLVVAPVYLLSWALNETAPGNMIMRSVGSQGYVGFITVSILNGMLALSGGGWGAYLLTPWWSKYWNEVAAYRHDAFAKAIGQKQGMIDYLEHHSLFTVATPYSLFAEESDVEMRIDALMK
jgi:hypothetical protein